MSNQKDIENKKIDTTETDFKARRRLLKVSAAAPLIVTLSPNAALAQGSLTCAQKNNADNGLNASRSVVDGGFAEPGDQAVRRSVELYRHKNGPSNGHPDLFYIEGQYYTEDGEVPNKTKGYSYLHDVWVVEYFDIQPDGSASSLGPFPVVQPTANGATMLAISCAASIGMVSSSSIV